MLGVPRLPAAALIWTNTAGGNWSVTNNWSPNQIPGAADAAVITNSGNYVVTLDGNQSVGSLTLGGTGGTQTFTTSGNALTLSQASYVGTNGILQLNGGGLFGAGAGNLTVSGQLNWTGGALGGASTSVAVATNGVLTLAGVNGTAYSLGEILTNAGTVHLQSGNLEIDWCGTNYGAFNNGPGALVDIQADVSVTNTCGGAGWANQGTVRKSGGTGVTVISATFNNSGTLDVESGTVALAGGGTLGGTLLAEAGAALDLDAGAFALGAASGFGGAGNSVLNGATLTATGVLPPNLQYTSGNLILTLSAPSPGFTVTNANWTVNGVVTNVTLGGGVLDGNFTVAGTLTWTNGTLGDRSAGVLVAPNASLVLAGVNGTTYSLGEYLTNAGTIYLQSGNLVINYCGTNYGELLNLPGALVDFEGDVSLAQTCGGTGWINQGTVRKSAGTGVTLISAVFNSSGTLDVQSGTVALGGGGNQSGLLEAEAGTAIYETNCTINEAETILGAVYSAGGTVAANGSLTVSANAELNLIGSGAFYVEGPLTNNGTVLWSGSGYIFMYNSAASYYGAIWNLPGAVFNIATDQTIYNQSGAPFINNQGTLEKTAGTGSTGLGVVVTNTGTVEALSGTLNFNSGGSLGGVYTAALGAAINFNGGIFSAAAPTINGPGPVVFSGGTLTLLNAVIPGLPLSGGAVLPAPTFQGGAITNLTLTGSALAGTNTVTGTLTCGNGFTGPLLVAAGGTFNWTGGAGSGPLLVASNGLLNLSGGSSKLLQNTLTNLGTVTWTGTGGISLYNYPGSYYGAIWNLPGAVFNIATDENISDEYGYEFFNNQGTLEKTAGTGTTYLSLVVTNTGMVAALSGTLNFNDGGSLGGSYTAAAGAAINFTSGNFTVGAPPQITGPGAISQTGGTLTLSANVIPNLALVGGTVELGANFEGGTITNLTLSGTALTGTNTVTGTLTCGNGFTGPLLVAAGGTFNWTGGTAGGSLMVASNGLVNISGSSGKTLQNTLTNLGTVTWTGTGGLTVYNYPGSYYGAIWNLPGAVFNIATDENISDAYGYEFFNNQGTLEKTAGTGTTYISLVVTNTGTVAALSGTLNLNNGGSLGGDFTAATGAALNFSSGNFTVNAPTITGPGAISLTGGTLTLAATVVAGLDLAGGTVVLGPNFEGGTITNFTLAGSKLTGTNTVTGTLTCGNGFSGPLLVAAGGVLNWTGGTAAGPLTVASNALLNISGSSGKTLQNTLTNLGTVTWTGAGGLTLYNYPGSYYGAIWNLPGAVFNIATDENINDEYGNEFINNQGTLEKTAGTGTTYLSLMVTNSGTVAALSGTLNFNNGGYLGGNYSVAGGAVLNFDNGSFSAGEPVLAGPGPVSFTGGLLTLLSNAIPNLSLTAGTVALGPSFEGGTITNLTLSGSTLIGTNTVTGSLIWTAGTLAGPLTVGGSGALLLNGSSTKILQGALTNLGTVTWTGTGNLQLYNNNAGYLGSIYNQAGGLFQIQNDQNIECACYGYEAFNNQGTVEKLIATNTTLIQVPFTNTGTLNLQSGLVSFTANPAYVEAGETLEFGIAGTNNNNGRATLSGNINFDGTLDVNLLNGFTPALGSVFTLFNYGAHAGTFSSLNLPLLPNGENWEVAYTGASLGLRVVPAGPYDTLMISGSVTDTNGNPIAGAAVQAFINANTFTNPVVNGSFELPTNNGVSYTIYNPGSTNIPGWTVTGPGAVDISGGFQGAAEDGAQYFDPTGNASGTGGGVVQTFPTTVGAAYKLSFFLGYHANPGQISLGVTVGSVSNSFAAVTGGAGSLSWTPETVYFTATSNLTTVALETLTTYNSDNNEVDNVQVTPPDYGRVLSAVTDANGHYQIAVANGTFQVGVSGLPALGYNNVGAQTAVVAGGNQTVNFTAPALTGAQLFTITTAVNPPGAGTAGGGGTLGAGAIATVTATPVTNTLPYLFADWTENGVFQSATNNYAFTVIRSRNLVANFTLPLFTITASNNPANGGLITGAGAYYYAATNVLTATPAFGFNFTNWTEGTNVVGASPTLTTVVFTNHTFVANYIDANLNHGVGTVTAPPGVAAVTGAGSYTNGQTVVFSAPGLVTNSPFLYTFEEFTLSNTVVSVSNTFTKTFSTLDATNLQYVAVYKVTTILPEVINVTANYASPVPATTNFLLALQFDRSMNTNFPPVIGLTNSAATLQPTVATNGYWTTTSANHDTYHAPPVTLSAGMDGTMQLFVSGAQDLNGDILPLTNAAAFTVQATPPPAPVLSLVASNSSSVTVGWPGYNAPADLAGFRVYLQTTNYTSLAGVPVYTGLGAGARSYDFGGLALNSNYYLAVQAVDTVGNALTAVTTLPVFLPSSLPPPVGIQVAAAGAASAVVSWNSYNPPALLGFAGYFVYYEPTNFSTVAGLTPQTTVGAGQVSVQINGLNRTQTNYFAVVGYNNTNGFNPQVTTAAWTDPYAGNIGVTTAIGGAGQSAVNIYHSIVVVSNAALIVAPGTTLRFAPGTSLTVAQGALVADGTALAPIIFDSANDVPGLTPAPGDWGGITLAAGAGTSSLEFVEILYGGGLSVNGCTPTVQALTATGNTPWGLGLSSGAVLNTGAALLTGNGIGAEQLDTASLTLTNSVILNNNTNAWAAGSLAMNGASNWWGSATQTNVAALLAGNVLYTPFLTYEPLLTPALGTSNGLTQVGGAAVLLQLACRTAVAMRLSEDFTFAGVFFSPFTNYDDFPLSAGGGEKHIFAQFRSVTGETNSPIELDVNYVTAGPVIQSFSLTDGETLNRPLTVTGAATATLGMQDLEFYLDGVGLATNTGGSFSYYFDIRSLNNAVHQAELLARDNAGNLATLESDVIIAVTPPLAPVITSPAGDYLTNHAALAITGTAEPGINIQVTDNGQVLGVTTAGAGGNFAVTNVTLAEGVNTLVAVASDNTGTTPSTARHITVETIPPAAVVMNPPVYTPGAGLALTWQFAASGKQAGTFELFWATSSFTTTNQATAHSIPLSVMSDTLQGLANGTYYFGVVGFDAAGNPSPLSALVSTAYNATPPVMSIAYGEPSPVGVGPLTITLSASEALAATPTLTLQPAGAAPVLLSLTNAALNIWQTVFNVTPATPAGTAGLQTAARDQFGNVFNGAPTGAPLVIDTTPPTGTIVTVPAGPVPTINDTNVAVSLTLSKPAQAGTTPTLNFQAPIGTHVAISLTGAGSNWSGTLPLTPAMSSGFGKFTLSAEDSVGNIGTNIISGAQLELYNTALPSAPADPTGLAAVSLPGGYIKLTWNPVGNAQIYRLYREPGTNFTLPGTLDIDNITNDTVTDFPTNDGLYAYAVSASRLGSESGFAGALIALSDRTPPPAPTNVAVALAASGVQISWQEPPGATPDHYNVYRNGTLVGTTSGPGPAVDYPPKGTNIYVVDSSDAIGNQNPSAPVTNILLVAPVVSLAVVANQGQAVLLSWNSTDASATGFNVYRNGVRQNPNPLPGTNYTDNLPLADAVTYAVTAVNQAAQESPPRLVNVYPVVLGLQINPTHHPILINYFDQYQAGITNLAGAAGLSLTRLVLNRSVNGISPLIVTQTVQTVVSAGAGVQTALIVPEASVVASQTVQLSAFQQTDNEGSSVVYQNAFTFTNAGLPGVEIAVTANQLPLVGGLTAFQAQINNPGTVPIDIVTSRGSGANPGDLYISVQNNFGQEVGRTLYLATPPGTTFLPDGRAYVQINPGASLSLTVSNVLVPAALAGATNTAFVAVVTNIYNQIGTSAESDSGPLTGSMISPSLAEPPYYGTAQTDQSAYDNNQPIVISGRALSTATGLPVPGAPLNIGFASRGYVWFQSVTTDTNGNYQLTYNPIPGFGGMLSIWAAHPLVVDQLNQAQVVVYRVYANPAAGEVEMSKNGTVNFTVNLINPGNVPLTGFTVNCAAYQLSGTNMTPLTTLTGTNLTAAGFTIAPNQSQTLTLQLAAAINAPASAEAVFTFTSAEGAVATLTASVSLLPAVPVLNIVSPAAGYVEADVNRGDQVSRQVTIVNSGLTTLQGITLQPPTNVTWMQLNLPVATNGLIALPDLPAGQSNTFTVVYTPPAGTPLNVYQDDLVIRGTNLATPFQVNLYAIVTSDQTGAAQFEVEDFLADQLSGASVRLQNNLLQASAGPFLTDTNGLVTVTNLAEGVWNWQVTSPGCSTASGTVTIQADQTAYQNPILSRSLVTINFTVVPVPFTDQYEIQVSETYATFAPVPELVLTPPLTTFNNVTPGFQANFNVTAQNPGLIQLNNVSIKGAQDSKATLTPLVTFLPVLLPQQTVEIPFTATYLGTAAPSQQDDNGGCDSGGGGGGGGGGDSDSEAADADGDGDCPITGATVSVNSSTLATFDTGSDDTFSADSGDAASDASCEISGLIALGDSGDNGDGGDTGDGGDGSIGDLTEGDSSDDESDGCLAPDTAVLMADGTSKPISQIQTNDVVRTGSHAGNLASVRAVYVFDSDRLEEIDLAGTPAKLLATTEHFFWVDGRGWRSGAELRVGDWLFDSSDHRVQISNLKMMATKTKVYTLKLSGASEFYANNVLVHDLCGAPPAEQISRLGVGQ